MNNWKKYMLVTLMVTAAGVAYINYSHRTIPADLRDAVADNREFNTAIPAFEKDSGNMPVPKAAIAVKIGVSKIAKGYVVGAAGEPSVPVEWIPVAGGGFTMGSATVEQGFEDAKPAHEVAISSFEMSKTAVTVEQYAECVTKDVCTEPATGRFCNWGRPGRELHPVNCVDWGQAQDYANFKGARLPSESEWEYAAKSGGKDQKYPWGNGAPTCDKAVMNGNGGYGCGANGTMPVCSKPAGNTAQGLCDMSGNVGQWVKDAYEESYELAPIDGSATYCALSDCPRVVRGGAFNNDVSRSLRADMRYYYGPGSRNGSVGFRLAR